MKIKYLINFVIIFILLSETILVNAEHQDKIVHVVLIWLDDKGNKAQINKIIQATKNFRDIPGVQEIRVGRPIKSERSIVDDSFDVGLYMIFNSREQLNQYLIHPKHVESVSTLLEPLAKKIRIYDFKEQR